MRSLNLGFLVSIIAIFFGFLPMLLLVEIGIINFVFAIISYSLILASITALVLFFKIYR